MILLHIAEMEKRQIYAELGYDGMYSYLVRKLGYSEGSAYRRLHSARLLNQVPELAVKIEEGSLNLTQLAQVQKCLKDQVQKQKKTSHPPFQIREKALEVLNKLEHKNSFETQRTLAKELGFEVKLHDKAIPQKDDSVRLEVTLTADQYSALIFAKDLLSHVCPDGNWGEVISELAERYTKQKLGRRSLEIVRGHPALRAESGEMETSIA